MGWRRSERGRYPCGGAWLGTEIAAIYADQGVTLRGATTVIDQIQNLTASVAVPGFSYLQEGQSGISDDARRANLVTDSSGYPTIRVWQWTYEGAGWLEAQAWPSEYTDPPYTTSYTLLAVVKRYAHESGRIHRFVDFEILNSTGLVSLNSDAGYVMVGSNSTSAAMAYDQWHTLVVHFHPTSLADVWLDGVLANANLATGRDDVINQNAFNIRARNALGGADGYARFNLLELRIRVGDFAPWQAVAWHNYARGRYPLAGLA